MQPEHPSDHLKQFYDQRVFTPEIIKDKLYA